MNQMFPGTIWSYLGSPERITWSFTSLVKQNTFFALTPTGQVKVHCQTDSFLYDHHTWECLKYISILNSVHPCSKPLNHDLWSFMKEEYRQDTMRNKKYFNLQHRGHLGKSVNRRLTATPYWEELSSNQQSVRPYTARKSSRNTPAKLHCRERSHFRRHS